LGIAFLIQGNRPAIKRAAKTGLNSIWGKGIEKSIRPQHAVLNHKSEMRAVHDIFKNIEKGGKRLDSVFAMSDWSYLYQTTNTVGKISPELHNAYAPASIFVAAYGRIKLYRRMAKAGKALVYNDTDSVITLYDPSKGPRLPNGDILGDWGEEKISKKGIVGFVSLGPKTYALKTKDGDCTIIKAKGISLNHSNSKLVNFETMKRAAEEYIENGRQKIGKIPQSNFIYSHEKGMRTRHTRKDFKMNPNELKGVYNPEDQYIWPFGSSNIKN